MPTAKKRTPAGEPKTRGKRVPIHESRDVLKATGLDPNMHYRWVNDVKAGTRLAKFENAAYTYETNGNVEVSNSIPGTATGMDSRVSKIVGVDKDTGEPIRAYLMKLDKDLYAEDAKAKADEIAERERGMFRKKGLSPSDAQDTDGFYGGIKTINK